MTLDKENKMIALSAIFVFFLTLTLISLDYNSSDDINAFATTLNNTQTQPNINAKSIYDTGTTVLGNNVKNLIILIPDEAHHGNGEAKENRFIVQSFLPQNAVVNKGTKVIWFSGDVSHEHRIIFDKDKNLFDSGNLPEYSASNPMIFNTVGDYSYYSPDVSEEALQKGFVMKGDVKVIDQPNNLNTGSGNSAESVGVFMVPTKNVDEYTKMFTDKGFSIDNTYSFKDVRGLARDTGSEQTLIVWTAGPTMSTDMIISALKDIGSNLPYK